MSPAQQSNLDTPADPLATCHPTSRQQFWQNPKKGQKFSEVHILAKDIVKNSAEDGVLQQEIKNYVLHDIHSDILIIDSSEHKLLQLLSAEKGAEKVAERGVPQQYDSKVSHYDIDHFGIESKVLGYIKHVLSKRERPQGTQYLVVWVGFTVNDARWVPLSSLKAPGAVEAIHHYEAQRNVVHVSTTTSNLNVSNVELDVVDIIHAPGFNLRRADSHEVDLTANNFARPNMMDGRIDMPSEKHEKAEGFMDDQNVMSPVHQEELGLCSDGDPLIDENESQIHPAYRPLLTARGSDNVDKDKILRRQEGQSHLQGAPRMTQMHHNKAIPSRSEHWQKICPKQDAEIVDREESGSYDQLVAGTHKLTVNQHDSGLLDGTYRTWDKGRKKKQERKRRREKLHTLGFLGKKSKTTYSRNGSLYFTPYNQINKEIERFLLSEDERYGIFSVAARKMQ